MRIGKWVLFEDNVAQDDHAVMCRFDIRGPKGELYLRRYRLFQSVKRALYFHKIFTPDHGQDLHDHPWDFKSVVLKGHYFETHAGHSCETHDGDPCEPHVHLRKFGDIDFRDSTDAHKIDSVSKTPVWTMVFTGERERDWGFYTEHGWVSHSDYEGRK